MKWYYLTVKTHFCIGIKLGRLETGKEMLCFIDKTWFEKEKHLFATKMLINQPKPIIMANII